MEDPRELILNRVRQNTNDFIIDYKDRWNKYILSSIIDSIFYTLADYISIERKGGCTMGKLEIEYHCTDDFINSEKIEKQGFFIGLHTQKITTQNINMITENLLSINKFI